MHAQLLTRHLHAEVGAGALGKREETKIPRRRGGGEAERSGRKLQDFAPSRDLQIFAFRRSPPPARARDDRWA